MFSVLRVVLCGVGPKQRAILGAGVDRGGGQVLALPRDFPLFGASKARNDAALAQASHVVTEDRLATRAALLRELCVSAIPEGVRVVHSSWLADSLRQGALLPEAAYSIFPHPTVPPSEPPSEPPSVPAAALAAAMSPKATLTAGKRKRGEAEQTLSSSEGAACTVGGWGERDGCVYKLAASAPPFCRVLAMDMDSTLIKTRSGSKFPKDEFDWVFFSPEVPAVLKELHAQGFHLALLSNQGGLDNGRAERAQLQRKVDAVLAALDLPCDFLCAARKDRFRKPRLGMWDLMLELRAPPQEVRPADCIYVGDAAGRRADGRKDFSDADLLFALNLGCTFRTPESMFQGSRRPVDNVFAAPAGRRLAVLAPALVEAEEEALLRVLAPSGLELVLLVAPAACGKSSVARRMISHARVNQDELKTLSRCEQTARTELARGRSVVVDATNLLRAGRAKWVALGREQGAEVRCLRLDTSKELAMLLRTFRVCAPDTLPEDLRAIEDVTLHTHFKRLEEPRLDEGYFRLDSLPFKLRPAAHPEAARLQTCYL